MVKSTSVAIVGAGPYGLSLASHLAAKGVNFRLFGRPMEQWRTRMPRGMHLKSDGWAANLFDPEKKFTLERYCTETGIPYEPTGWAIPVEVFYNYGCWFQQHAAPTLEPKTVLRVERADGAFRLTLDDGEELVSQKVVLAIGITHFPYVPENLSRLPPELVSHAADETEPAAFAGKDVTIVGRGASALTLATLLHEAGATARVITREDDIYIVEKGRYPRSVKEQLLRPDSLLGPGWRTFFYSYAPNLFHRLSEKTRVRIVRDALGPAGGWHLENRVEGSFQVLARRKVEDLRASGSGLIVRLTSPDGVSEEIRTDHLVAATGYRVDLNRIPFLPADIVSDIRTIEDSPRLNHFFESSVPNLFFVGLAAAHSFGPLMRFATGAGFASRTITRAVA